MVLFDPPGAERTRDGGGGGWRGGGRTKQRHESLKSVSSQGHADLRERLTPLGLPETGSKARGSLSDGVGTGQDGKSQAEEWEVSRRQQLHFYTRT